MRIAISAGHAKYCQGAIGPSPWGLNEVECARQVTKDVAAKLNAAGVKTEYYWDDVSTDSNSNLNRITDWHNNVAFDGSSHELDISVHLNAYSPTSKPMGCEVCYLTQSALAAEVSSAMADALDLPDRGAKYRSDLWVLNQTSAPCILLECCFVDSSVDAEHFRQYLDRLTTAIAEAVGNVQIDAEPPEPPEVVEPPPDITEDNRVEITSTIEGDVTIYINGTRVTGHDDCEHVVDLKVQLVGDVVVVVNGEDFHNKPPVEEGPEIAANHTNITTTVFGGAADGEYSAYPPYDSQGRGPYLNDTNLYVALPVKFEEPRPRVRVYHGELSAVADIMDIGPWVTNDLDYVFKETRPIAETCYEERAPLPAGSGPNAGEVPTNPAGLDISPALAEMIGIDGKGTCNWEFVSD